MIAQGQAEEAYAVTEMTVRELVTEWLHVTASRIKESTAVNYAMKAEKHLIPAFGEIKCCLLKSQRYICIYRKKAERGTVCAVSVGYYRAVQVRVPLCKP